LIQIKNTDFQALTTLDITVKEGSLIPKDPLTQRNEAMDLWTANALDPITLGKRLDMPDPVGYATQLILWQMLQKGQIPPQAYIPGFSLQGQVPGQGGGQPPVPQAPNGVQQPPSAPQGQPPETVEASQLIKSVPAK
jgi:hypothetical protein